MILFPFLFDVSSQLVIPSLYQIRIMVQTYGRGFGILRVMEEEKKETQDSTEVFERILTVPHLRTLFLIAFFFAAIIATAVYIFVLLNWS